MYIYTSTYIYKSIEIDLIFAAFTYIVVYITFIKYKSLILLH